MKKLADGELEQVSGGMKYEGLIAEHIREAGNFIVDGVSIKRLREPATESTAHAGFIDNRSTKKPEPEVYVFASVTTDG